MCLPDSGGSTHTWVCEWSLQAPRVGAPCTRDSARSVPQSSGARRVSTAKVARVGVGVAGVVAVHVAT